MKKSKVSHMWFLGFVGGVSVLTLQSACDKASLTDETQEPNVVGMMPPSVDPSDPITTIDFANACECGPSQLVNKQLVWTVSSTGSMITTANLTLDSHGNIQTKFAPFTDPLTGEPFTMAQADRISIQTKMDTTGEICGYQSNFGAGSDSKADIVFILDTTSSMGSLVTSMANSINAFAQSLADANLDVRYAALTVGDAFATKYDDGSSLYGIGSGIQAPPSFDSEERPYFDFTSNVADFKGFIDGVKGVIGAGIGGLESRENYYGAVVAASGKSPNVGTPHFDFLHPRKDALRYVLLFGDDCAYSQEELGDNISGIFTPPAKAQLSEKLGDSQIKIHSVSLGQTTCPGQLVSFKEMSDASSGTNIYVGPSGNVDLNVLKIADLIKNFWKVNIHGGCARDQTTFKINATLRVKYAENDVRSQHFTFDIQVI